MISGIYAPLSLSSETMNIRQVSRDEIPAPTPITRTSKYSPVIEALKEQQNVSFPATDLADAGGSLLGVRAAINRRFGAKSYKVYEEDGTVYAVTLDREPASTFAEPDGAIIANEPAPSNFKDDVPHFEDEEEADDADVRDAIFPSGL